MKKTILSLIAILVLIGNLKAGWSYHAHINYLKESISILDYYDYEMCLTYKDDLIKGITEGEIQYKYRAKGNSPKWMGQLSNQEINFLQGHTIDTDNVDEAVDFFYDLISSIQKDIVTMDKPYSSAMFELGYILHSIDNILLPLYEAGHFPEQQLASDTKNVKLDNSEIEVITDLKPWLKKMIEDKIEMRNTWSEYANNNNREGFIQYATQANQKNIYTISSILQWVVSDCYGPENIEVRTKLESMHENQIEKTNGRKAWK